MNHPKDRNISRKIRHARRRLHNDIERMDYSAKQRYLRHHLFELEQMIDSYLAERLGKTVRHRAFEMIDGRSKLWEDLMDLDYLEASRQAILQAMADLRRQKHGTWEMDGGRFGD